MITDMKTYLEIDAEVSCVVSLILEIRQVRKKAMASFVTLRHLAFYNDFCAFSVN